MSDDHSASAGSRVPVPPADESVTERIARAYDLGRVAPSQSLVASDFRLDLTPDRRRALAQEREAIRARVFGDM